MGDRFAIRKRDSKRAERQERREDKRSAKQQDSQPSAPDTCHQPPVITFTPRNENQAAARRLYKTSDVLFLVGPAGCGKTITAVGLAALDVCGAFEGGRQQVLVVRPVAQADRSLGYLKGTLDQKLAPYKVPITENLAKVALGFPPDKLRFEHLGYLRGRTLEDTVVIVDECQNCTYDQLVLVLGRLGENSKVLFTGDPQQPDIASTGTYPCDLLEFMDNLSEAEGVGVVRFAEGDSVRHPRLAGFLRAVLPRLRKKDG